MKKLFIGLLIIGLTTQVFSQITKTEHLSEVVVVAVNYKYLNQVDNAEAAIPVELLQKKVANFDLKNSEYYQDDYDYYSISFYIPQGKILAAYDKDGNIIRTIERYNDIALPKTVASAIATRFPGWSISKDLYLINYFDSKGATKKYKLTLENGDQKIKVKLDGDGNFL